jgi:exodeoxyribonuclease-1
MADSFFFYDLETSGFNPRTARIMQFAGQRTDLELKPIGEPVDILIKLTPDVLPQPDAILITGITPQKTLADGVSEAEFLKFFYKEVAKPDTIFAGYNNVRFDDEFMRFLHYRNFYDAYEWQWRYNSSRWDLLDVVRMTRALRPEGIIWPFASDGKPTNRLEFLTTVNKLDHLKAHDALSDVHATIAVARLIREKQKDMFDYLLSMRGKKKALELVSQATPFVYTSGRYSGEFMHTTVAVLLAKHIEQDAALVYDLRYDPTPFLDMNVKQLIEAWRFTKDPEAVRLPVKTLKYNRCPAVAPLGVIKDQATQDRLQLDLKTVSKHFDILKKHHGSFATRVAEAVSELDKERAKAQQTALIDNELNVDERLYDGFITDSDKTVMSKVRTAKPDELAAFTSDFRDKRLQSLLPLYKARNYPKQLTQDERAAWDTFVAQKLLSGEQESRLAQYFARLQELASGKLTDEQQYLLEELRLYGESLAPSDAG